MRRRYKDMKKDLRQGARTTRTVANIDKMPPRFENYPQAFLEATHHPYAPFPGDTLRWNSWVWHDASMYEGIMRYKVPHGKGTFTVGARGCGAGFRDPEPGDVYEGEFMGGFAHGLGQYKSADGRYIYKGRFKYGLRDGCGMRYDLQPLRDAIASGERDEEDLEERLLDDMDAKAQIGRWVMDEYRERADPEDDDAACSMAVMAKTMEETDSVVARARMFAYKPDGDATFYKHHVDGAPMPANQHPLHYPHGTLFMAPGPAGQTAPLPNDPDLHELMLTEVENYISIHESYNFDYDPEPDSMFGQALQWEKEQMDIQNERLASKGLYRDAKGKIRKIGTTGDDDDPKDTGPVGPAPSQVDFDDSDLVADASALIKARDATARAAAPTGFPPLGTAFGSLLLARPRVRLPRAVAARAPVVASAAQRVRLAGPRGFAWPQQLQLQTGSLMERAPQWLRGAVDKVTSQVDKVASQLQGLGVQQGVAMAAMQ